MLIISRKPPYFSASNKLFNLVRDDKAKNLSRRSKYMLVTSIAKDNLVHELQLCIREQCQIELFDT